MLLLCIEGWEKWQKIDGYWMDRCAMYVYLFCCTRLSVCGVTITHCIHCVDPDDICLNEKSRRHKFMMLFPATGRYKFVHTNIYITHRIYIDKTNEPLFSRPIVSSMGTPTLCVLFKIDYWEFSNEMKSPWIASNELSLFHCDHHHSIVLKECMLYTYDTYNSVARQNKWFESKVVLQWQFENGKSSINKSQNRTICNKRRIIRYNT